MMTIWPEPAASLGDLAGAESSSKFLTSSRRADGSGFPRRRIGRFGSSMGGGGSCTFTVSCGLGAGVGGVAFSAGGASGGLASPRCKRGGASLSSILGVSYFLPFSGALVPAGSHVPSAFQTWLAFPGRGMVKKARGTPSREPSYEKPKPDAVGTGGPLWDPGSKNLPSTAKVKG